MRPLSRRAVLAAALVAGLLRPVHRRGYIVKPITLRDVNDLFELRSIIEVATVRITAGRIDETRLRHLEMVHARSYRPGDRDSEADFLEANTEFHMAIARVTNNDRLILTLAQTLSEMERLFHFGLAMRNRTSEMSEEHQALITALARGNADEAERVTRQELESSKAMVMSALMSSESLLDVSISRILPPQETHACRSHP